MSKWSHEHHERREADETGALGAQAGASLWHCHAAVAAEEEPPLHGLPHQEALGKELDGRGNHEVLEERPPPIIETLMAAQQGQVPTSSLPVDRELCKLCEGWQEGCMCA